MAICKLLFTLSVFLSASNGEVFGLAPVPGAVSIPFSRGPHPHAKRSGTTDVYFASRYLDYIVNLTIGTPPQKIFLSLDTGSSDTLLVREETPLCIQNAGICPDLAYYDSNKSSSYKALPGSFTANYGFANVGHGSSATGSIATETFVLGGTKMINQEFLYASKNTTTLGNSILGLSYASGESLANVSPPMPYDNFPLTLAKQGATNLALFSLWKDRENSYDGQILFGGVNTGKYSGDLLTLDTQVRVGGTIIIAFDVLFNGLALSGDPSLPKGSTGSESAVLDCGTSSCILPDDWVKPLYDQFSVTYFSANDTAYVDCDLSKQAYFLNFTFQDLTIPVPIQSFISLRAQNPDICSFDVVPAGSRHPLLGNNFLSHAYTVFDITNNQISLAVRDFSSTSDNVVVVPSKGVKAIGASPTGTPSSTPGSSSSGTATASSTAATHSKSAASVDSSPRTWFVVSVLGLLSLWSL